MNMRVDNTVWAGLVAWPGGIVPRCLETKWRESFRSQVNHVALSVVDAEIPGLPVRARRALSAPRRQR